jgi:hypothetical protein
LEKALKSSSVTGANVYILFCGNEDLQITNLTLNASQEIRNIICLVVKAFLKQK